MIINSPKALATYSDTKEHDAQHVLDVGLAPPKYGETKSV